MARFPIPKGYERIKAASGSFAYYLRQLPLKPQGSKVLYYDGSVKDKQNVYCGVIAMDIGNRDLQQCADAVMRLRGEYLFAQQQWDQLGFEFTKDQQVHYFINEAQDRKYASFRSWMNPVFTFANTRVLHHQLHPKAFRNINIGDVFIQTGNPYGHAITVIDIAQNLVTADAIFMLAQSYMPAQDIQVLVNPGQRNITPWYSFSEIRQQIYTLE